MSSAVLVTLRFKRIASIRVIGKPYALQNGASVRWPAACQLHTPLDYWSYKSCKAPVKSSPPTNQTNIQFFYRLDALPVTQPTMSKH